MDAVDQSVPVSPPTAPRPSFWEEFQEYWSKIPEKWLFLLCAAGWVVLYQYVGISSFNFGTTRPSLFEWLYNSWNIEAMDCEHGKLIPWVVVAIFWVKRRELMPSISGVWPPGLVVVGLALAVHMLGYLGQQPRISMVGFFMGIYGFIGVTWGWRTMWLSTFPMALFAFCMPLGNLTDHLTLQMRMISVRMTYLICHGLLDINVIQNGTELRDADGIFRYDVAAACSGIRSFVALLAITTIFAMLSFKAIWKRALMLAATFPLVVVCNVLRLSVVVLIGRAFGQNAGKAVHDWFWIVTYSVAIASLMGLAKLLREDRELPHAPA